MVCGTILRLICLPVQTTLWWLFGGPLLPKKRPRARPAPPPAPRQPLLLAAPPPENSAAPAAPLPTAARLLGGSVQPISSWKLKGNQRETKRVPVFWLQKETIRGSILRSHLDMGVSRLRGGDSPINFVAFGGPLNCVQEFRKQVDSARPSGHFGDLCRGFQRLKVAKDRSRNEPEA